MAEIKGPTIPGSTQGQIKTPMAEENIKSQGGAGQIHSYKKAVGDTSEKGNASIEGPGADGKWTAGIKITGCNTDRKY